MCAEDSDAAGTRHYRDLGSRGVPGFASVSANPGR